MRNKKPYIIGLVFLASSALCGMAEAKDATFDVVPRPVQITLSQEGGFTLDAKTQIAYPANNERLKRNAQLLASYINELTGFSPRLTNKAKGKNLIALEANLSDGNKEAYRLTVTPSRIVINGASAAGNFYGIQTLRKAFGGKAIGEAVEFPSATVYDRPRFSYRGGMFDVVRHFFPADSVKRFIDMLALHNANVMHWHLTDDQGWRLELKRYPELAEKGQWRTGTCIGKDFETSDNIHYGGYYTQEQVKDIIKYAADRYITVIPEIEIPGHLLAALQVYPEYGCTGGPYKAWTRWGVSEDILCAGNDRSLDFIDNVLDEVIGLFPSKYIHVGGDEAPKKRWEQCPKCQARIKQLGLKSDSHSTKEQKLQSWLMAHALKTVKSHGRKMIGWDEIIEGGPVEGATVMAWRGMDKAREAAKQNHDVIMTPTEYCYFDYGQSLDPDEPLSIGGFISTEKVYGMNPMPEGIGENEAKHIVGVQANLWTEYIPSFSHVMYMELPRFAAMSEVQWCNPGNKDYKDFTKRLEGLMKTYDAEGFNYAKHLFDVAGVLANDPQKGAVTVTLETIDGAPIHYTLDGTDPTAASALYKEPLVVNNSCTVKARAIRKDRQTRIFKETVNFSKATGRNITLATTPHTNYDGAPSLLVDGIYGSNIFNTGHWLGFEGKPLVATIDLGEPITVSEVSVRNNVNSPSWIFDGRGLKVEVSNDGKNFTVAGKEDYPAMTKNNQEIVKHVLKFAPTITRYVRITELCETSIPSWHDAGAGQKGFLFIDEIGIK